MTTTTIPFSMLRYVKITEEDLLLSLIDTETIECVRDSSSKNFMYETAHMVLCRPTWVCPTMREAFDQLRRYADSYNRDMTPEDHAVVEIDEGEGHVQFDDDPMMIHIRLPLPCDQTLYAVIVPISQAHP